MISQTARVLFATGFALSAVALPADLESAIGALKAVGPEGRGNDVATGAWKKLAAAGVDTLPDLLAAMDGANDYALNWLRSAIETLVQRETAAGRALPTGGLESFLKDTRHHPRARRFAYELIVRSQPQAAQRLVPGFVNDPAPELRREAVQHLADVASQKAATDKAAAIAGLNEALGHAREADQIEAIAKKLADLGEKPDLQKVFGWVTKWKVIGPFDNVGEAGFTRVYGPEDSVDFGAEVDGKNGKVRWADYETKSEYGLVDFNKPFTALKGAGGYAAAEIWSDSERDVQVRLGSKNGWKVWMNGKYVFGRDEYHRASEIDQYRLPVRLKAGRNVLLVKCLQNEQTQDWAVEWEFQLRLTDEQGTPVVSTK